MSHKKLMSADLGVEGLHRYILRRREKMLQSNIFYKKLLKANKPAHFQWCESLHYLSKNFTELLRVRFNRFPNMPHDVFEIHYREEVGHSQMLRDWMLMLGLKDPDLGSPTFATSTFVSFMVRVAYTFSDKLSLVLINSVAEGFASDLFRSCLAQLQSCAFPSLEFWKVHVVADEGHSNVSHLVGEMTQEELRTAAYYCDYMLDAIDKLLVSWSEVGRNYDDLLERNPYRLPFASPLSPGASQPEGRLPFKFFSNE